MASKFYSLFVVVGILIIALTAFFAAYIFFEYKNTLWTVFVGFILLIEIMVFVRKQNSINKDIAIFFNSINNHDTTVLLPYSRTNGFISEVYDGMRKTLDVFQSVKMESEFKEKLFMSMIEHSTTGFISIDQYGDFEIMNQMARKLLKVEYTSNIERIKSINPELYRTIESLTPGDSKLCKIHNNDFSTSLQVSMSTLNYKDRQLRLVSLLDIQKELEAGELESWQKLIRIMNHEIMNSIAPITSTAKTLKKIFTKNEEIIKYNELTNSQISDTVSCIEIIDTMSAGLMSFVSNYREMSNIPKISPKQINIKKWSFSLEQILNECVKPDDKLEIIVSYNIENIHADENLLNQVLINLVQNASHAPIVDKPKQIRLKFSNSISNSLKITAWNNGEVIKKDILENIFIPFFTTKSNGAGIGLYISRQIINAHGGSLSVVSEKNFGTEFTIIL